MIRKLPLPLVGEETTLYRSDDISGKYKIVLAKLTKAEEDEIDNYHKVHGIYLYTKNGKFVAKDKNILSYGEINIKSKEDIDFIRDKHLMDSIQDVYIPLGYNYDTNEIIYDTKEGKHYKNKLIGDPLEWFKYKHGCIGKPKRIIIYKRRI